jgi:phage tail-like protein
MAETQTPELPENELAPFHVFKFQVSFTRANLPGAQAKPANDVPLCSGAFAECTGLEATMEPKVIKSGGANYGPAQRVGQVTFATVVLKRGMTTTRDLWNWFQLVAGGSYSYRLDARITLQSPISTPRAATSASRNCTSRTRAFASRCPAGEAPDGRAHPAHRIGRPRAIQDDQSVRSD